MAGTLFADHGFDDVTMARIAREAGVARATVFNYFGSKYAVVEAITETVLAIYRGMLDESLADDTTPTPSFSAGCARTWARGSRTSVRSLAACSARSCAFNSASTKAAWPNAPRAGADTGVRARAARPPRW